MQKVLEYERHADACRRKATETKNPQLKKPLEDMADVWDRLALQRRQGVIGSEANERDAPSMVNQGSPPSA
jgi:hypothetical protein